jgi:hypothetical protein
MMLGWLLLLLAAPLLIGGFLLGGSVIWQRLGIVMAVVGAAFLLFSFL